MFGEEAINQILDQDAEDRANRFENNMTQTYKNAWGMPGDSDCVFCVEEAYRYCTNAQKTFAPEFENRATVQSIQNILEYNPDFAVNIASPTAVLFIHATRDVVPLAMVEEIYNRTSQPKKLVVTDSLHTDLYGTEPYFTQAVVESIKWFRTYLFTTNTNPETNSMNTIVSLLQILEQENKSEFDLLSSFLIFSKVSLSFVGIFVRGPPTLSSSTC